MNHTYTYTRVFSRLTLVVLLMGAAIAAHAQFTATTLESGNLASGIAKDASNNIYVVRFDLSSGSTGGTGTGQLVKYSNGTGSPTVLYSGIPDEGDAGNDYATGIVVAGNGDIYLITDNNDPHTSYGEIIKLKYVTGNSYTSSVWQTGTATLGYYSALAIDPSDNLYVVQYNFNADDNANEIGAYEVDEYAAGSAANAAPIQTLYDQLDESALSSGAYNAYSTGLAVAPNGDVYVTSAFNLDNDAVEPGYIYKLTKASSYSISTISSGFQPTGLSVDTSGNLYALQGTTFFPVIGSNTDYGLYEYPGGIATQSPAKIYTPLHSFDADLFPYGIAIVSSNNIFVTDGQASGGASNVLQLINSALPVTWLTFTVMQRNGNYEWDWSLAEELNVAGYIPQYSSDGVHFTDVGKVTGFNSSHTYQFSKELSLTGNVFFRIREVDKDGKSTYSVIRSLLSVSSNTFTFYPNPAASVILLQWPYADAGIVNTYIINSEGKIVLQQNKAMAYPIKVDLAGVADGTYFIYGIDNNNHKSASLPLLKISE